MPDQVPFGTNDFAENPEPRCPCVLVLDTSGSMDGDPIEQLKDGVSFFRSCLSADSLAAKRVEVAVVTFGPVQVAADFTTVEQFNPPLLKAESDTPLGEAILKAIEMVTDRKQAYRQNGLAFYRPWIFLVTDGAPNPGSAWREAADRVKEGERNKAFAFFAVGVEGADFDVLKQLSSRAPLRLKGLQFREMFLWLSNSMQSVSRSQTTDTVPLENPTGPQGWATV